MALIQSGTLSYGVKMRTGMEKRDLGRQGEVEAERFLLTQGYEILARNYRCLAGELDLVARDHDTLVFVEVRTQSGPMFGDPLESVTFRKQRQVIKVAMYYTTRYRMTHQPMRFDVIGINWAHAKPLITHIKGAFELPSAW